MRRYTAFAVLLLILNVVHGAGVGVHLTLLARAKVPDKIRNYEATLKAGTFFPDALYSCNQKSEWHDFAEYTHWPAFLIQGAHLWEERYSHDQGCENSLRLKAFLTGVFIHQVTDVSWHSLVEDYRTHGLVRALAELEFEGDFQRAHDYIDTMGDVLMLGQILRDPSDEWSYYIDQDWELPIEDDLMELVRRSGLKSAQYWEINVCVQRGSVALTSEVYSLMKRRREVLEIAYDLSPRARDLLQGHWLGGETNVIAMVNKCLPTFFSLFEEHKDYSSHLEKRTFLCGNLPPAAKADWMIDTELRVTKAQDSLFVSPLTPLTLFGSDIAIGAFQNEDLSIAVSAPLDENEGSVYVIPWSKLSGTLQVLSERPVASVYGNRVHAYTLGETDFLVISSSGENTIYFYRDGVKILSIVDDHYWERHQLAVSSIQDIDGDGIPDLLLAGPHYGLNETGIAIIIDGRELVPLLVGSTQVEVSIHSLRTITLKAPLSHSFQNFGSQLTASSVQSPSGFLYVTCQGLGVVFAYSLCNLHQNALPRYYIIDDNVIRPEEEVPLDLRIKPSRIHGMFGHQLLTWNDEATNFLAISQHLQNKVYIYREQEGFLEYYAVLLLDVATDVSTVGVTIGFGKALEYDSINRKLYISSPGYLNGDGAIWAIEMQEIRQTVERWNFNRITLTLARHMVTINNVKNGKGISDFGQVLKMGPEGKIVIGSPRFGYGDFGRLQLAGSLAIL